MKSVSFMYIILVVTVYNAFAQNETIDFFQDPYLGYPLFFQSIEKGADGDILEAEKGFRGVLSLLPFHLEAGMNLRICDDINLRKLDRKIGIRLFKFQEDLYNMNELQGLNTRMDGIIKNESDYDIVFLLQGNMYYQNKRDSLAVEAFSRAITLNPNSALSYFYRGRTLFRMGKLGRALQDFSTCLEYNSELSQALYQRGILYSEQREFDAAIRDFEKAMAVRNDRFYHFKIYETYNNRGIQKLEAQRYLEALRDFDEAIKLDTRFGEVYMNRGMAFKGLNVYDSALVSFNLAEEKGTHSADLYFYRAGILRNLDKISLAIDEMKKALKLDNTNPVYHFQLAELQIKNGQYAQAIPHLKSTINLDPETEWAFYQMAFCYDNLKKYHDAIIYYEAFLDVASSEYFQHIVHVKSRVELLRSYLKSQNRKP